MWTHSDDALDIMWGTMALDSLWKEEIAKMYPRQYYPAEISFLVSSWEYKNEDFRNWFYVWNL